MRILFLTKDATLTGAPMVLLHLLKWLKENTSITIEIVLIKGGELEKEFLKIGATYLFNKPKKDKSFYTRLRSRVIRFLLGQSKEEYFLNQFRSKKYDLVYANTVATYQFLEKLKIITNAKTIMHVHELENVIKKYCGSNLKESKSYTDAYIACSKMVQRNLIDMHQIEKVHLIHEFVPSSPEIITSKEQIKLELGIPNKSKIIGGCGPMDWRKGIEFFLQVAHEIHRKHSDVCFVWLGGTLHSEAHQRYQYDINNMGLEGKVVLTGSKSNPQDYFNAFDIFLMTSKEDPFPLVCIENAMLRNPIICFNRGVGSTEFIDNQVGYLSLSEMCHAVNSYLDRPNSVQKDGDILFQKAQEYTLEKSAEKVFSLIKQTVNS